MNRQVLRKSGWVVFAFLHASSIARPLPAAVPSQSDAVAAGLKRELREATAVQVLLIPPNTSFAVTLADGQAARGRVHSQGCRYLAEDPGTVSGLLDIVDDSLIDAGAATYSFGSGGGDLRLGILFEKDGQPLRALYLARGPAGWAPGVFDNGWLRLKADVRERIEAWLAMPRVRYGGGPSDDRRPFWRSATGQVPLPCTQAEMTIPEDAQRPPPPPPTPPEFKAAIDAALKNRDATAARFQAACERDAADAPFCACLLRKLPGPYTWDINGWPAYMATLAQGRYAFENNPWYPAEKYTDEIREEIFDQSRDATRSCEQDSTPPPLIGPVERIGYPPAPPPPPVGRTQSN